MTCASSGAGSGTPPPARQLEGGPAPAGRAPAKEARPGLLFCQPPRQLHWSRPLQVAARTVHVAAMGLLLGGIAFQAPPAQLRLHILLTVISGLLLLAIDLGKSFIFLYQGAGAAVLLKLLLIGAAHALPAWRLELYLAATAVASVGSHMNSAWRHFSLLRR